MEQISLDDDVEKVASKYANIHSAKFDKIVSKLRLPFNQQYTNLLYEKYAEMMSQMKKINTRKMLVCVCHVLNECVSMKWNHVREIALILIARWIAENPTYNTPSIRFELDMYMPIIIGDMLNLVPKSRVRWPACV